MNTKKNQLKNFIESPTASQKFSRCIATIQESLPDECKQFCESLSEVDFNIFEECTQKALSLGENWSKVLSYYSPFFKLAKKRYAEKKVELMLSPYASIEYPSTEEGKLLQHRKALITDVEKSIEKGFAGFKQQTLPVLIQMLISTDSMLQRGSDLVENLKYEFYQNADLNSMLADGCGLSRGKLAAFLFNKLHFGDILTRDAGDTTEFMLCMTPPCDILRPEKVNFNIVFIRGREIPICELSQERKENCHLSVLSIRNGESTSLRYVCWEFFNISRFDLMDEDDYKDLCTWERPFRMTESYVRQISNLFTAHFARAGVDEMFMKSASNLRGLFV